LNARWLCLPHAGAAIPSSYAYAEISSEHSSVSEIQLGRQPCEKIDQYRCTHPHHSGLIAP
jgi:hypothetical protein